MLTGKPRLHHGGEGSHVLKSHGCLAGMWEVGCKKYVSVSYCLQSCPIFHLWHLLIFWLVHLSWFVNGLHVALHSVFKTRLCVQ